MRVFLGEFLIVLIRPLSFAVDDGNGVLIRIYRASPLVVGLRVVSGVRQEMMITF